MQITCFYTNYIWAIFLYELSGLLLFSWDFEKPERISTKTRRKILFLTPKLSQVEWFDFPDCPEFCVLQKPDGGNTLAIFISSLQASLCVLIKLKMEQINRNYKKWMGNDVQPLLSVSEKRSLKHQLKMSLWNNSWSIEASRAKYVAHSITKSWKVWILKES